MDALLLIKRSLFDPNGNLSNWNKGDPCNSNWTGVLCYNTTLDDNYLHVAELYDFKYLWTLITYVKTYLHLSFGTSLKIKICNCYYGNYRYGQSQIFNFIS